MFVKADTFLKVLSGRDKLSSMEQSGAHRIVGLQQEVGIFSPISNGEELFAYHQTRVQRRAHQVKPSKSPEYLENLGSSPYLLAQFPRPIQRLPYFGGAIASHGQ
jgi:hypothetical protein